MNNETKMKEWLYRALRTAGQTAGAIVIANFAVWMSGVHDVSSAKNVIFGAVATVLSGIASALMNMNKASVTVIDDTEEKTGDPVICTGSSEPETNTVEANTANTPTTDVTSSTANNGNVAFVGADFAQPGNTATQAVNGEVVTSTSEQSEPIVNTAESTENEPIVNTTETDGTTDANAVG